MIISITNNDQINYNSILIYLKEFCNLNTNHEELLCSKRINNYEQDDKFQSLSIPVLLKDHIYTCSFENIDFQVHEETSVKEHVATHCFDIKTLKRLIISYPDDCDINVVSSFSEKVAEYKSVNFSNSTSNMITHYIATQFLDWEKSDSYKKRDIDTLYLPDDVKNGLINDINFFYKNENTSKLYEKMGIPQSRTYLFYGNPGTGKTTTCNVLASYLNMNIGTIDFTREIDDNKLRFIFKNIPKNTILLIEDIDRLIKYNENNQSAFSFSGLLNILDGINKVKKLICVITCNDISILDKALIRRIDYSIEFSNIVCNSQIIDFMKNLDNNFVTDEDKKNIIKFFTNKPTTINIIQKWFLLHYQNVLNNKYNITDKLSDFHNFNKWYNETSEKGLYT